MLVVDIIRKKREGQAFGEAEIAALVQGMTEGKVAEYQVAALLMAIFFRGMESEEIAQLTRALADSGEKLDLEDLKGPKVTLHSAGGIGDKLPLIVAPLAASCGVKVPMMLGRGLG